MKRFVSMLLTVILLCTGMMYVAHAEEATPYASAYFSSYGASLTKVSSGRIEISFSTTGTGICTRIGVANYYVEKLNSRGNWEAVTGLLPGSTGTNTTTYTFSKYFNGVRGETYRVKVTFICTLNGDSETKSYTSGRVKA